MGEGDSHGAALWLMDGYDMTSLRLIYTPVIAIS